VASLRETQRAFAAALRSGESGAELGALLVRPVANLGVYRNNAEWQFRHSLSLSFPVVRRRVGDDYFRQLAFHYRARFPSRSGDLHWVGRSFPAFLAEHLAGTDYAWLAGLADLEWSREQASVAEVRPAIGAEALARFAPEHLAELVFELQPSLFLGVSIFPVLAVWQANQEDGAPPVDQSVGEEHYMVRMRDDNVDTAALPAALFAFLRELKVGVSLGEAMSAAGLDESGLLSALQFVFSEGLVVAVGRSRGTALTT
jgi:hypothetical protein